MTHRHYVYMVLAALCLATIGVLVKLIGDSVPLMSLNFLRVFIAFIALVIMVSFVDRQWYKIKKKDALSFFAIGVLYAISISLYTAANLFSPVHNVVLIMYSYPFFVLIFGYFLLKEQITLTKVITLVIAFIGLSIINPFQFGADNFGNILALFCVLFYALLITEMRKQDKTHRIGIVVWFFLFASLLLLPFPLINGVGNLGDVWGYVVLLGVFSTGLAYLFYNLALEHIEAEIGSVIAMIITPLVTILLAFFIIHETLNLRILIGGALLILSGIYLETHYFRLKKKT